MRLYVIYDEHCDRSEEQYGDGRYDYSWEENYSSDLKYILLDSRDSDDYSRYESIDVDFTPKIGDELYVVVVNYDTGDSFGRAYGRISIVDVFDDQEKANAFARYITDDAKRNSKKYSFEFLGREVHACWKGYFESFNYADVYPLSIRSKYQ